MTLKLWVTFLLHAPRPWPLREVACRSVLTRVVLWQGGLKVQEASFIFQELGERYNWTVSPQNSDLHTSKCSGWFYVVHLAKEAAASIAFGTQQLTIELIGDWLCR